MMKWNIDPDHSVAAFNVVHLTIARVRGQFNKLSGTLQFSSSDKSDLSLEVVIDAAGIYTGILQRDEHLSSPDFFDVATFPTIRFRSTDIETEGRNQAKLTGQLTIHGISRQVTLDAFFTGPVSSPEDLGGETAMGLSARTLINREDFGMTWNVPLPGGAVMVGREIEILLDIEADLVKQD
ncbi:MAG: YceI family protein [Desulfobulbaceae bacterium]|nr:YceI family protein [Desulfobulbaceae bacterium]